MDDNTEGYEYKKRDDIYIFSVPDSITQDQMIDLKNILKDGLPEGSKVICLKPGFDYIPPENETLMKRLDDVEASLQELINLVGSRTR